MPERCQHNWWLLQRPKAKGVKRCMEPCVQERMYLRSPHAGGSGPCGDGAGPKAHPAAEGGGGGVKSGPATLQQAFEVRTIENALNKVTDQRATRGPAVLVSEVFESCEQLAVYNERDQRLSRLESVVGTHRRCPDSEDCFLHRVVALPTVATLVDDLEVVDIVASAARPGNDVIDVQIFWIERPKAQAADASRLLPEHGQQSTNGRHSSDLTRADLLEDVDDLTIERAVLALGELGQPTMQIGVQPA